MIQFLFGQDIYRSREELRKIIEEYKKTNPDWLDFIRIDCRDNNIEIFGEIRKSVDTVSMFNQNKLIVIENIFLYKDQDEILEFIKKKDLNKNKNILIVFWDEKPDRKTKLFKFLQKTTANEFNLLKGAQLRNWIKNYINEQGGKIDNRTLDKLIEYVGSDLWRLSNEINKLINYNKSIQTKDVELLVKPEIDLNIFKLVDALGYKNKDRALNLFKQHLEKGEDENYLFSMFIYQIRNLIKIKSGGGKDLHPFVFKKSQEQARNFTLDELKKIYYHLLVIDLDIKIGRTDLTTALELLVAGL